MGFKSPSWTSLKSFFGFLTLLFYADPTWLDRLFVCVGFVAAIAAGVPFPLIGIVFGQLVDDINGATCDNDSTPASAASYQSSINDKVLLMVYIAIASFVLIYVHIVCWNLASQRLAQRIRERYLRSLLKQDIAFFDVLQAGEVSSRLNGDVQAIETGTSEKVGVFLTCISFCVTAYVIAFIKDAKLAGMLVSLVPAFFIMNVVGGHYIQKYATSVSDYFSSASAIASEGLGHIGLVHALGATSRLEERFQGSLSNAKRDGIKKAFATAVQAGLLYFIAFSANALAYWQGSRKIAQMLESRDGNSSVGEIYTVIFILVDGSIVLSQVAPLIPLFGGAVAAFERLKKDINHTPTIDSSSTWGDRPVSVQGRVDFRGVSFTYPSRPEHPVLDGVSFSCEAGKLTAIVGLSGSGKSTVASLVTRFYDPQNGSVALDGVTLPSVNVKHLRGFIGLVPQEPSLLDRSILENIAHGLVNSSAHDHLETALLDGSLARLAQKVRDGADLDVCASGCGPQVVEIVRLVQEAASLADALGFINRQEFGFATLVGTSGGLISGGQKQRIALARALVRDPSVLVLDEATAALDSVSEQRIQAAIERASKGRTVISIAHRLSTIRFASKIIVMRTGKVIEQGTHDELIAMEGSYAEMVRLQSVKSVNDDANTSEDEIENDKSAALEDEDSAVVSEKQISTPAKDMQDEVLAVDSDSCALQGSITKTILPMLRPYLLFLVLAFFAALIVGFTYPGTALVFGNIMSSFSPCNSPAFVRSRGLLLSGLFFMLACVEFLANFTSWFSFGLVSERLIYKVRIASFQRLFHQPLQWHQSNGRTPAMLLEYITKDGNSLAGFSGSIIGTLFAVVVNFIAAIILSHIVAWRIAIVCLVTVPLLLGAGFMQLRSITRFAERHASAFSTSISITVEAVSNIRTVAALSLETEVLQTYRRSLTAPRKEMVLQSIKTNVWLAIANSTGNIIYAFAYWWGSKNILEGRYSQTQFFIILMAMLVSAQLWGQLFTLAPEISRAKAAISRIAGLLSVSDASKISSGRSDPDVDELATKEKDIEAYGEAQLLASSQHGAKVEFCNVSFSYPARPNIPVLSSLSLVVQSGQFCALVGPSGAGKSTVLALLERFYTPSAGFVSIDGFDISRHFDASFRDDIAYVPQDNVLFQGSIKFNIALGSRPKHNPTDAEIEEACRIANIHDAIVSLPQGYDTDCGAGGSQLSGGQRQRLSIARALVRKPRLLLLDESTSALDAESENALEAGLETAVKGKGVTVIAIAHRLRTIMKADKIFVVDGGKVVDQGRHEELIERSDSYRVNALHQMLG